MNTKPEAVPMTTTGAIGLHASAVGSAPRFIEPANSPSVKDQTCISPLSLTV